MANDNLEQRLRMLEQSITAKSNSGGRKSRIKIWTGVLAACAAAIVFGFFVINQSAAISLPSDVEKSANFPIYYPAAGSLAGYSYKKNSAKLTTGILFYTLQAGDRSILISEQAIPSNPPDLSSFPGFKKINALAGNAILGMNLGQPVAIVLSNTTLISAAGSKNIPSDVLGSLAASLQSIPNQP